MLFSLTLWSAFVITEMIAFISFIPLFDKTKKPKSILYLENFPIENAGYQYRTAKWAELLRKEGYHVEIWTLIEDKKEFEFKRTEKPFSKFLIFALRKPFKQIMASRNYETVIVRRELLWFNDYGNLFLDKLLLKFHPNSILDFDDDLAAAKGQPKKITNLYGKLLMENGNKFNDSLRLYKRFFVASNYLKTRVLSENPKLEPESVCVIPTCVDYDKFPGKVYPDKIEKLTFGWIGGDHNYAQLDTILPILNGLGERYQFKLLVVGGTKYMRETSFELEFRPWSLETEIRDILDMDVGLMPLENNLRTQGKGGFKLLQYMGLGVVSVASAITINKEIIDNGENSFLCNKHEEWLEKFKFMLNNKKQLNTISGNARKKIIAHYSFNSQFKNYLAHIQNA